MLIGQLSCRCCNEGALCLRLMIALDELMILLPDDYNLIVHSGYRCCQHNIDVGGVKGSRHTMGEAIDLHCDKLDIVGLLGVVTQIEGFEDGGIGVYEGPQEFLHLDVRGYKARWHYREGIKIPWGEFSEV